MSVCTKCVKHCGSKIWACCDVCGRLLSQDDNAIADIEYTDKADKVICSDNCKTFLKTKDLFVKLCDRTKLPAPDIGLPKPEDPCDFTSHEEVRFNIPEARNITPERHAAHVFGHYLCNLHEWADQEGYPLCDQIADVIADLLD